MSIFENEYFTLKELCYFIKNNEIKDITYEEKEELNNIAICYILFTSNNENYKKYLKTVRETKGFIMKNNEKNIYFREILQICDMNFTKLMIRIHIENKEYYDIFVNWKELEETTSIKKDEIKKLIYKNI